MSRQAQKASTQRRVLDAARELFQTVGYEASTIRDIASLAGVSVGSVFNAFASKRAILSAVMQERLGLLHEELQRVLPHLRGSTLDRLRSIFAIHYAFQAERVRTYLAHIASAYATPSDDGALAPFHSQSPLTTILRDTLVDGIARGDIGPGCDLDVTVEVIMAAYAWNYRMAAQGDADSRAMSAAMDAQLGLIFQGVGGQV